jgi:hypothetical protein
MAKTGPLYVDDRDRRDLDHMIEDYRRGLLGRRTPEEEVKRRQTSTETTKLVALTGILTADEIGSAIVLAPTTSKVFDVNCTGLFVVTESDPKEQTFPLSVRGDGVDTKVVKIPFTATADEFHQACGFDSSVTVWLGAVEFTDTQVGIDQGRQARRPMYRWLVDVGTSGWVVEQVETSAWVSLTGTGSPDVTQVRFTGTNITVEVQQPIPPPRFLNRQIVYAEYTIDWSEENERWELNFDVEPTDGVVIAMFWDSQSSYWQPVSIGSVQSWYYNRTTYAGVDGDTVFLNDMATGATSPTENPPEASNRRRVTWIYLNGKWLEIYNEITTYQRAYLFGLWGYGWGGFGWGWGGGGFWGGGEYNSLAVSNYISGSFALAHKAGSRWMISSIEKRALYITQE